MIIPGFLVSWATFPGVIVHEAAHMLACRLCGVPVLDVCFFRFGNPAGYVMHARTERFGPVFLIAVGPFLVNSLLCIAICLPTFLPIRVFHYKDPLSYFLMWLGVSIGMHAFPSTTDAKLLWTAARRAAAQFNPLAWLSFPLVVLIYLANVGSIFWLDLLYGVGIGWGLPEVLIDRIL